MFGGQAARLMPCPTSIFAFIITAMEVNQPDECKRDKEIMLPDVQGPSHA